LPCGDKRNLISAGSIPRYFPNTMRRNPWLAMNCLLAEATSNCAARWCSSGLRREASLLIVAACSSRFTSQTWTSPAGSGPSSSAKVRAELSSAILRGPLALAQLDGRRRERPNREDHAGTIFSACPLRLSHSLWFFEETAGKLHRYPIRRQHSRTAATLDLKFVDRMELE